MTEISLILLDLNGVLYRYDREARVHALASISHLSPALINAAIWDSGFEDPGDAGAFDADAYLPGFAAAIGYDLSEAEWVAALGAAITPIPEALALVRRIRTDITCAVLTNNNLLVRRHFSTCIPRSRRAWANRPMSRLNSVPANRILRSIAVAWPALARNRPPRCLSMTARPMSPVLGRPDWPATTPPAPKTWRQSFRGADCSTDRMVLSAAIPSFANPSQIVDAFCGRPGQ